MNGSAVSHFNLLGALSIKDKISLGAYYSVSLNEIKPESENVQVVYIDYRSVGGFAEYTLLSKNLLHAAFSLYLGYREV
jgi:hypothetical protein